MVEIYVRASLIPGQDDVTDARTVAGRFIGAPIATATVNADGTLNVPAPAPRSQSCYAYEPNSGRRVQYTVP